MSKLVKYVSEWLVLVHFASPVFNQTDLHYEPFQFWTHVAFFLVIPEHKVLVMVILQLLVKHLVLHQVVLDDIRHYHVSSWWAFALNILSITLNGLDDLNASIYHEILKSLDGALQSLSDEDHWHLQLVLGYKSEKQLKHSSGRFSS